MAGHLLFIVFINVFSETKGQDIAAPTLSVTPSEITEVDNVTLHCQTPSTVYVSQCHFNTTSGQRWSNSVCVLTLRGSDLLMVSQHPPAEVQIQCDYSVKRGKSPLSDKRTVRIQKLAPPTLTVEPSEITETDRVTLHCHTPVSEALCHFQTVSGPSLVKTDCVQTLRGSDLLMVNQRPPVEVQVQCYYTVERGQTVSSSPYSHSSFVMIQINQPHVTTALLDSVKTTNPHDVTGSGAEADSSEIWKLVIPLAVSSAAVVSCVLVLAFFCTKRPNGFCTKSSQENNTEYVNMQHLKSMLIADNDQTYSGLTPAAEHPTCDANVNANQNEEVNESNTHPIYASIPDEPVSETKENSIYITLIEN